jgi:hypothetical protein
VCVWGGVVPLPSCYWIWLSVLCCMHPCRVYTPCTCLACNHTIRTQQHYQSFAFLAASTVGAVLSCQLVTNLLCITFSLSFACSYQLPCLEQCWRALPILSCVYGSVDCVVHSRDCLSLVRKFAVHNNNNNNNNNNQSLYAIPYGIGTAPHPLGRRKVD